MNQYRVSLWIDNLGDIPDVDLQFQMVNAEPTPGQLVIAAFFVAQKHWARLVVIQVLREGQWSELPRAKNVSVHGMAEVWINSSSVS